MKNETIKYANRILDDFPVTKSYLNKVLNIEALHTSTNNAFMRLLEIIEYYQKQSHIGEHTRKFRKCWIDILKNLAVEQARTGKEVPRRAFLNKIGSNDFSVMRHWPNSFIEQGEKVGYWKITKFGLGFILGKPGYRWIVSSIKHTGLSEGKYTHDPDATSVTAIDIYGGDPITDMNSIYQEWLENLFKEM